MKLKLFSLSFTLFTICFQAHSASFDCANAKSQIEKAICADSVLGGLDEKLGKIYSSLRSNLTDVAKNKVRASQS